MWCSLSFSFSDVSVFLLMSLVFMLFRVCVGVGGGGVGVLGSGCRFGGFFGVLGGVGVWFGYSIVMGCRCVLLVVGGGIVGKGWKVVGGLKVLYVRVLGGGGGGFSGVFCSCNLLLGFGFVYGCSVWSV